MDIHTIIPTHRTRRNYSLARWTILGLLSLAGCLESLDPQLTPVITAVNPEVIAQGGAIEIQGTNFAFQNAATTVSLVIEGEGQRVEVWKPAITINPSTRASVIHFAETATLPPGAYEAYLLIKDRENDRTSNKFPFTIEEFRIDTLLPARGQVGTEISIVGNGLTNIESVQFPGLDGIPIVVKLTSQGNSEIKAIVPPGALPGIVDLKIKNRANPIPSLYFKVTLPLPTITAVTPSNAAPGSKVVVTGTNLGISDRYTRQVFFEDKNKNLLEAQISPVREESSANQITVFVPAKAATGNITVSIDTVMATETLPFTVTQVVANKRLVFNFNGQISVIYLNDSQAPTHNEVYVPEGGPYIDRVTLNTTNERIYFYHMDPAGPVASLRSVTLEGEDEEIVFTFPDPYTYVTDLKAVGQHVYWLQNSNTLWRCGLDGANPEQIGSGDASTIEIDPAEQFLYAYNGADPLVRRIPADGSSASVELFTMADLPGYPDGMLFKLAGDRLFISYYTDPAYDNFIVQGALSGDGSLEAVPFFEVQFTIVSGIGYDTEDDKVYWIQNDANDPVCYRSDRNGENKERLFSVSELGVLPAGVFSVY